MFVGTIIRGKKVDGYINNNLLEASLEKRHNQLTRDMKRRGYAYDNHSMMNFRLADNILSARYGKVKIDRVKSYDDLTTRCKLCLEVKK